MPCIQKVLAVNELKRILTYRHNVNSIQSEDGWSWGSKGSMKALFCGDETPSRFAGAWKVRCLKCATSGGGMQRGEAQRVTPCQDVLYDSTHLAFDKIVKSEKT